MLSTQNVYHAENYDIFETVAAAGETKDLITNHNVDADIILTGGFLAQTGGVARNFRVQKRTRGSQLLPLSDSDTDSKSLQNFLILKPSEGLAVTFDAGADVAQVSGVMSAIKRLN